MTSRPGSTPGSVVVRRRGQWCAGARQTTSKRWVPWPAVLAVALLAEPRPAMFPRMPGGQPAAMPAAAVSNTPKSIALSFWLQYGHVSSLYEHARAG